MEDKLTIQEQIELKSYYHKKPFTQRQKAFYSETERFELSVQVTPHNTLAGCRLKPTRPRFHWHLAFVLYILS